MKKIPSLRPILIGTVAACGVLALGLSKPVQAVNAALVSVVNTAANPVPVSATADRDAHAFGRRFFPNVRSVETFVVPAGQRLVIDSVTGFAYGGTTVDVEVDVVSGGVGNAQRLPFAAGLTGGLRFVQDTHVHLVADPGTTVYFVVDDNDYNDTAGVNIDVHGYYVAAN